MIVVHHLEKSRSLRVLWLLEELGLDYTVKTYKRDPQTLLAPADLRAIHPLGKAPIIVDGDLILAETGAIVEYLIGHYGKGRLAPTFGTPEHVRYLYWLHYGEGSAMPPLLLQLIFDRMPQGAGPLTRPLLRRLADRVKSGFVNRQLKLHFNYIDGELAKNSWFAGPDFTGADIMMSYPLEVAAKRGGLGTGRPHLLDFLARIHARPAYQKALGRGGE
jgi:glutathione S-transferase